MSSLLEARRRLAAQAASRPWKWSEGGAVEQWADPDQLISYRHLGSPGRGILNHAQTWQIRDAEADFIAQAANDYDALLDVAEAAALVAAYHQAGGTEWWEAHSKLYRALNELGVETPMAE